MTIFKCMKIKETRILATLVQQNDRTSEIDFKPVILTAQANTNAKGLTSSRHIAEICKHVPNKSRVHTFKCESTIPKRNKYNSVKSPITLRVCLLKR